MAPHVCGYTLRILETRSQIDMKQYQKKICIMGDFAVGKTSLIRRYIEGIFDEKYLTTVGVVVSRKSINFKETNVNLLVWDLAGGHDFSHTGYLTGAAGALLVCDITRASTLTAYYTYAQQIRQVNPQVKLILLANKSDLLIEREVTDEELSTVSADIGAPVILTSAKTGEMVEDAFTRLAQKILSAAN